MSQSRLVITGEVAINYLNSTNYMFFGGLIMAIAVEHSGLHNRSLLAQGRRSLNINILQDCLENYNDGGHQPGQTDARLHDHHNVSLNVDVRIYY